MPIHALERLKERYREDYTEADLRAIEVLLMGGNGKEVAKRPRNLVEYLITYNGRRFRVLYSPASKRLVTVLTLRSKPPRAPRGRKIIRDGRIRAVVRCDGT